MYIKLLELLDLVKSEKLICSTDFKKHISEFPLKYLNIIKYKINDTIIQELSNKINDDNDIFLQYLNLLFTISENSKYDSIIKDKFKIEEREIKLYLENYCERDKNSINIYGNYYKTFIDNNNILFRNKNNKQNYFFVYKLEFSMYFFEDIIYEYLYDHIKIEYEFFKNIIDSGSSGGFFELLVDYYIRSSKSFLVNDINQTYYISSLVPQNYSIKYYSSKRKTDQFVEFTLKDKGKKKKKIPYENTYIRQTIFNSKYYNMAILIKSGNEKDDKNNNNFDLASVQATIKKDKEKRMTKDEHELILGATKKNIENEFDIKINKAYFLYVLSQKNGKIEDQETIKECNNNGIYYLGFDIDAVKETKKYIINYKNAFITETFPSHNIASLLIYPKIEDDEFLIIKDEIKRKLPSSKTIESKYFQQIEKIITNKYESTNLVSEQIKYFYIQNTIGNKIKDYLSDFSFFIFTKNKGKTIDIDKNNNYIFVMNTIYELKTSIINEGIKLVKNTPIMFCYSDVPIRIKNNKKSK